MHLEQGEVQVVMIPSRRRAPRTGAATKGGTHVPDHTESRRIKDFRSIGTVGCGSSPRAAVCSTARSLVASRRREGREHHGSSALQSVRRAALLVVKQPRSSKRQIEANRREKAERKRERKRERDEAPDATATPDAVDTDAVIAALAELHRAYRDEEIGLDELEAGRAELTSRLHVD